MTKTRKPKRYSQQPRQFKNPGGLYTSPIESIEHIFLVGSMVTLWPHIEEQMAEMLEVLLGGPGSPARQVFHSVTSAQVRIKLMKAMLETHASNALLDDGFDKILSDYGQMNGIRNDVVHSLWFQHESGDIYMSRPDYDAFAFLEARKMNVDELKERLVAMRQFSRQVRDFLRARIETKKSEGV